MLDNFDVNDTALDDLKLLIVDDEQDIAFLLKKYLESFGAIVTTCASGLEALEAVKAIKYDFVLTDINMPQMTGMELLEKINRLEGIDTKCIVMSGGKSFSSEEILGNGAVAYVQKPFLLSSMKALLLAHWQ